MKKRIYHVSEVAKSGEKARKTIFCETDATSCAVWVVRAGQEVAVHTHTTSDDVWVCLQGEGVFYLAKRGRARPKRRRADFWITASR